MNEREKVYYFLGISNDFSREDTIKSITKYSKLSIDEINEIIEDIILFNENFKKTFSE